MLSSYKAFIDRVIDKYEGGYGWNKKDPGGPTKYGITCYDYAEFLHVKMTSMALWAPKVQAMPLATAEEIYRTKYAAGVRYDDLPLGVDACMLDYAINSGVSRPILVAREIVRVPGVSRFDQPLLDAIKKYDPDRFINAMCAERLQFMHEIRGGSAWAEFGHGWGIRVADVKAYSQHLATAAPEPVAPDLTQIATPKAVHAPQTAGGITAAGAVGIGTSTTLAGADWKVGVGLALGALVIGVGYEAWQDIKATKANATVTLPAGA